MDTAARLQHLLAHWVEHNDAHAQTYREWAARAAQEGLGAAAGQLEEAVRAVDAATDCLRRAQQSLPAPAQDHDDTK